MAFDYLQLTEPRDAFTRHAVTYLVIGKSGALLHGFPDTTQDADLFVHRTLSNGRELVRALPAAALGLEADDTPRWWRA